MSRIAYIISAYKDAPHLARLVAALDDRADFYVHIDLNADIHPFEEALGDKVTFMLRICRVSLKHWMKMLISTYILTGKQTAVRSKNCCRKARSPLYKAIG